MHILKVYAIARNIKVAHTTCDISNFIVATQLPPNIIVFSTRLYSIYMGWNNAQVFCPQVDRAQETLTAC